MFILPYLILREQKFPTYLKICKSETFENQKLNIIAMPCINLLIIFCCPRNFYLKYL